MIIWLNQPRPSRSEPAFPAPRAPPASLRFPLGSFPNPLPFPPPARNSGRVLCKNRQIRAFFLFLRRRYFS